MTGTWLAALNEDRNPSQLVAELHACCDAPAWVEAVLAGRPYADFDQLGAVSDRAIFELDDDQLAQALAAHPRIGERVDNDWSSQEQAGLSGADATIRAQISDANHRYEEKFGQVYLVCATGLGPSELLQICLDRLHNDPATERTVMLGELAKIARIRLGKLMDGASR